MTREELLATIHKGVLAANRTYSKWSGGAWLNEYGVEAFMVTEISRAIQKNRENGCLTMEESFEALKANSGKSPAGRRPDNIQGAKRVDIALWNKTWNVTHVIEVKRLWNQGCFSDLDRLYDLQRKLKTIQCGLFVLLVTVEGNKKAMAEAANAKLDKIETYLQDCKHRIHKGWEELGKVHSEDGWTASSVCVELFGRN